MNRKLISLVLAGGIAVNLGAYETDLNKFIPGGAEIRLFDIDRNGIPDLYWNDKNKDWLMTPDEVYLDLNQDGIPDISFEDVIKNYLMLEKPQQNSIKYNKQVMRL